LLLLFGLNPKDLEDRAKKLKQVLLFPNAHEDDLVNTLYLIQLCPNGHEGDLVKWPEHFHRLVGSYRSWEYHPLFVQCSRFLL
jgi:hypothetical protein